MELNKKKVIIAIAIVVLVVAIIVCCIVSSKKGGEGNPFSSLIGKNITAEENVGNVETMMKNYGGARQGASVKELLNKIESPNGVIVTLRETSGNTTEDNAEKFDHYNNIQQKISDNGQYSVSFKKFQKDGTPALEIIIFEVEEQN